jgi:large subunit ribosomal protein L22
MTAERRQAPEGGWESLKVDELRDELEARGLSRSGRKDELVARLVEDDASYATPAAAAEAAPGAVAEEAIAPEEPADEPTADEVAEEEAEPAAGEGEPAAEAEAAEEEAGEEEVGEDEAGEAEPAAPTRAAETATTRPAPAAPRPDGALVVRARAKYVRSAPRKARLVMDHIRGKNVEQAQAMLRYTPRGVSGDILKLLNSAVANAESAYELAPDELRIGRAFVDEGPTIKRFRPRARGRATRILKRTSHITIELTTEGNGG